MADIRAAREAPIGGTACCALVRKAAYGRTGLKAAINFQKSQFMENPLAAIGGSPGAKRRPKSNCVFSVIAMTRAVRDCQAATAACAAGRASKRPHGPPSAHELPDAMPAALRNVRRQKGEDGY
jgi:hypothetical protein